MFQVNKNRLTEFKTWMLSFLPRCTVYFHHGPLQVLEANGGSSSGGILILVSDGEENESPSMAQVTPTLIRKEVIVHTILLSDKADQKMIKLATATGGKAFFDSGSYDSTDLQSAFRSTIIDDDEGAPGITPVEVGSVASERC